EKVEDNTKTRDNRDSLQPKTDKSKKHEVKVNTKVVAISKDRRNPTTNSSNTDATAQERKDREQLANAFARAGSRAKDSLSTSTRVDMPEGPGGGGVSYANFAQIVRKVYTDAWRIPDDVTDDEAVVKVSVTIARNGSVISSRIIVESGSRMVDRSIQNALDRVTTIGVAFPIGAKESQRTFTINFSLKAKKLLG
ncbi:MAG: TonB C-terminal domain-containing protein, partial [Verrucomicrobia bacterium]